MARVTYGSIITNIRGSIGGTTFCNNQYGFTAKNKQINLYSASPSQLIRRRILLKVISHWLTLSDADRLAWSTFASLHPVPVKHNSSQFLNGYSYYLKYNLSAYPLGDSILSVPTPGALVLPSLAPSLEFIGSDLIYKTNPSSDETDQFMLLYLSPAVKASVGFYLKKTRYISGLSMDFLAYNINEEFISAFGALPVVGDRIFCSLLPFGNPVPVIFSPQNFVLTIT